VVNFRIDAVKTSGIWRFADGREIPELYWDTGQPSHGYPTIGIKRTTRKWNDVRSSTKLAVLCEKVL
jgi:hypothetical protein